MSETDKQPYYSLPEQPYSDDELLLFAKHNLHFYKQGTFMHAAPYEQQEQYAELISRLPPSHQVLSVGIHAPSIVAASKEDFDGLLKRADYNTATPLGIFFHGTPFRGLRTAPIIWGGIFETREQIKGNEDAASSLTFRHEQGHRIDKILGCEFACVGGMIDPAATFHSHNPQWQSAVTHQLSLPPLRLSDKAGGRIIRADDHLYPGARRLDKHLSQKNVYTEADHPSEAFAEMTAHYTTLYDIYNGDEERIDARLSRAYPALWSHYRQEMIPLIDQQALQLYNNMEHYKEKASHYSYNIAYLRGSTWHEESSMRALRECELQSGLAGLKARCDDQYLQYKVHSRPVTYYYDQVATADQSRRPYTNTSSLREEWVPHLETFDERSMHYKDLLAMGIDVVPEIEALHYEAGLIQRFATHMGNALSDYGGLTPRRDRRWIMEDFDTLKQQFPDDRMESLQGIDIAISRVRPELYRQYALAYHQVSYLYYGDAHHPKDMVIPPDDQRGDRMDMYMQAMHKGEKGMQETIDIMHQLTDAETRYASKTHHHHHSRGQPTRIEWEKARNMFRSILRSMGEAEALREANDPSARIGQVLHMGTAAKRDQPRDRFS